MFEGSIERYLLGARDGVPNNDTLPLILYRRAVELTGEEPESVIEETFWGNDWGDGFRGDTFPFHHYHSSAHEVVGIARGGAQIQFGGPSGPLLEVRAGDAVVIPAGVVHCRRDEAPGFSSVGAYPPGQRPDLCVLSEADARLARQTPEAGDLEIKAVGKDELAAIRARIARIPLPETDPIGGRNGALASVWRTA